ALPKCGMVVSSPSQSNHDGGMKLWRRGIRGAELHSGPHTWGDSSTGARATRQRGQTRRRWVGCDFARSGEFMERRNIKIRSSGGGEFDCYVVAPRSAAKVPAMAIASAVHGVNDDVRAIADELAVHGYIAAAPDLFWRTVPGALARDDER